MNRTNKLKRILGKLTDLDSGVQDTFNEVDKELEGVVAKLKKSIELKTVAEVDEHFRKLQKSFNDLVPVIEALKERLESTLDERHKVLIAGIQDKFEKIAKEFVSARTLNIEEVRSEIKEKGSDIKALRAEIKELRGRKIEFPEVPDLTPKIKELDKKFTGLIGEIKIPDHKKDFEEIGREMGVVKLGLEQARNKGGSINRQINVNSSVMSQKYTDINFVSNTAILWSASNDDTNKRVNLTASVIAGGGGAGSPLTVEEVDGAPTVPNVTKIKVSNGTLTDDGGGVVTISTGGGGSGITRVSSTISVSSTFGASSQTDYVAFANVGIALTLPTAVGNGNLYTVKNVSNSSVVVISSQGIDDSPSALMPSNYESLSFISNSSIWGVV